MINTSRLWLPRMRPALYLLIWTCLYPLQRVGKLCAPDMLCGFSPITLAVGVSSALSKLVNIDRFSGPLQPRQLF